MTVLTDYPAPAGMSDPLDQAAALLACIETEPAVFLRGLDHHHAGALIAAGLPTLRYRRTSHPGHQEHLVVDLATGDGVRIDVRYDKTDRAAIARVAQTDNGVLFNRLVAHLTWWDLNGRPAVANIPAALATQNNVLRAS
ncbi:hypothetical protein GCM10027258_81410 [Amycolatopsis stemonae]